MPTPNFDATMMDGYDQDGNGWGTDTYSETEQL
eukprot:ctg_7624.g867